MNKADIEEKVTQGIIDRLEAGVAPWKRPWATAGFLPTSLSTGKTYRGINTLILAAQTADKGYGSPLWATFKQIAALGGQVRKGEKSTPIVFWNIVRKEQRVDGEDVVKSFPLLRYYNVFNVEQADGLTLPPRFTKEREPVEFDVALDAVVANYVDGPSLTHAAQGRAFYTPSTDSVTLPTREQFDAQDGYAETLFHELTHSTGHPTRCARFSATGGAGSFGCDTYAEEELVAEIGSALLAAHTGVDISMDNTAAYVASWLEVLKNDRSLVIKAAQKAQKAVDRILNHDPAAAEEEND